MPNRSPIPDERGSFIGCDRSHASSNAQLPSEPHLGWIIGYELFPLRRAAPALQQRHRVRPRAGSCRQTGHGEDSHGVWLKADGTVWVWGGNRNGQLGIRGDHAYAPMRASQGSPMSAISPPEVTSAPPLPAMAAYGPGARTAMANLATAPGQQEFRHTGAYRFANGGYGRGRVQRAHPGATLGRHCVAVGRQFCRAAIFGTQAGGGFHRRSGHRGGRSS